MWGIPIHDATLCDLNKTPLKTNKAKRGNVKRGLSVIEIIVNENNGWSRTKYSEGCYVHKICLKHSFSEKEEMFLFKTGYFLFGGSVALITFVLYRIRVQKARSWGRCMNTVRLEGKIVLITGANSGLGYQAAKELSARGAQIIMACRNRVLAEQAIAKIEKENKIQGNNKLIFVEVDLASLQSIKAFGTVVFRKFDRIDILVNNAGVSMPPKRRVTTADGFEIHLGVNYLSHVALTFLLMPLLEKAPKARILNVSSLLHQKGFVNLTDMNYDSHTPICPYADSKLQLIYFGQELASRVASKDICVYNLCPGWVNTNLFRHSKNILKMLVVAPVALLFMRSAHQGVQTIIYCATEPSLDNESGFLYRDCHRIKSSYNFTATERKQLWTMSEEMLADKDFRLGSVNV